MITVVDYKLNNLRSIENTLLCYRAWLGQTTRDFPPQACDLRVIERWRRLQSRDPRQVSAFVSRYL